MKANATQVQRTGQQDVSLRQAAGKGLDVPLLRQTLAEVNQTVSMVNKAFPPLPYKKFYEACMTGDSAMVSTLISSTVDVNYQGPGVTGLHVAAISGQLEVVRVLLDVGADVNPRIRKGKQANPDACGATPYFLARVNKHEAIAELLLERGANPDVVNDFGQSWRDIGHKTLTLSIIGG